MPVSEVSLLNARCQRILDIGTYEGYEVLVNITAIHLSFALKLAQPIRLLLEYTGTDYEDTRYGLPGGRCYLFG